MEEEGVRQLFTTSLEDLVKMYLDVKNPKKDMKPWYGPVINNNDPEKKGRCKIRIVGKFETLSEDDIPWAISDQFFIGSPQGSFVVPEVGTLVNGYFKNDQIYLPHYTTLVIETENLSDLKNEDYPNTLVLWETTKGDYLKINKKRNENVWRHASGPMFDSDGQGNLIISTMDSAIGSLKILVRGKMDVDAPIIQFPQGNVAPAGTGPFCCMPIDPLTGAPQTGFLFTRT